MTLCNGCSIQETNSQAEKSEFIDSDYNQTQQQKSNGPICDHVRSYRTETSEYADSQCNQLENINSGTICNHKRPFRHETIWVDLYAYRLSEIIVNASPQTNKSKLLSSILRLIEFLRQKVDLLIEEVVIANVLLKRFVEKLALKRKYTIDDKSIGMVIIVLFVLSMKLCRDHAYKNIFFSKVFDVPIVDLNLSEISFLKIMDHELFVDDYQFSVILQEMSNFEEAEIAY
ncbi:MAG: hypothetical protein EZS28_007588 [Streblomastix strix]|uniref:Cyclin N-terminal domain-containing protein n=1 Tax=Streblomastix strix TaxID=222440 RepID=A0A5J4WPK5_9EUKA|nr:MAG: hypothetical protein EZS28_007588 [Streblomastix strix]